jgi:hypothetical protein
MPIHDWTRVKPGIFHHFHHSWIEEITRALNSGLLPRQYYAMAEQYAAGFGPDVLALQAEEADETDNAPNSSSTGGGVGLLLVPPKIPLTAETEMEFYRRKQKAAVVRHVSDDNTVAMVEVVSPGNKAGRQAFAAFVAKAAQLLDQRIHLLILDLQPPSRRDPQGIHGAIWDEISGAEYVAPPGKPLTLAAYEATLSVRAFIKPAAVGDTLSDMPLFLEPGAHVQVPLEATYCAAFAAVPRRWREVLEAQ